jgi:hypothetical protein
VGNEASFLLSSFFFVLCLVRDTGSRQAVPQENGARRASAEGESGEDEAGPAEDQAKPSREHRSAAAEGDMEDQEIEDVRQAREQSEEEDEEEQQMSEGDEDGREAETVQDLLRM